MRFLDLLFREKYFSWLVGIGIFFLTTPLLACSVLITWQANTEPDLAGYKIYYGTQSRIYTTIIDVGNVTEYTVDNLVPGKTYYFAVTAYDNEWNESDYSQEVSYTVVDTDKPTIVSVVCEQIDKVKIIFSEPVEKISAELVTNYQINNGIVIQRAELQSDLKTVYLYTTQHSNGSYVLTVNNVQDTASVPNPIENNAQFTYTWSGNTGTPLEVMQAELYRNDFLAVSFNEPLDQTSALNPANYSISPPIKINSTGINATFKEVYLSTDPHMPGQTYTLTINNVKDGENNVIRSNSQITYQWVPQDTSAPILIAARLKSTTELELEFSENIDPATAQDVSNYTIKPSVTVQKAVLESNKTLVMLTTTEHVEGTYTVTVRGVGDEAIPPNLINADSCSYTYTPPDVIPPTLDNAELTSNDLLQLTFDEPLDQVSAEDVNNYAIQPHVNILKATLDVSRAMVFLQTEPHSAGNYRITVNGIKDLADPPNTIESGSYKDYSYSPPDNSPPELLQANLHGNDLVELDFSESLNRTSAEDISHYQIEPSVEIKQASLVGDSLNTVYLETASHQPGQSYTVKVHGITDRATVPNTIASGAEATYECPLVDNTPPVLLTVELQGDNFLILTFSEPLDQNSAEDTANYVISPPVIVKEATLDATGEKVFLKTGLQKPGTDYTLTVKGVKDLAANVIASSSEKSYSCVSKDETPPTLQRAELHGNQTLELVFSEPLEPTSALLKENYSINNGVSVLNVSLSQTQMEVFLETSVHTTAGTYTVTVNGVKDQATTPNTILPNSQVSYIYMPPDTTPPVLLNVTLRNPTMVELVFDEPLNRSSVEDTTHYAITNGIKVQYAMLDVTMKKIILQTTPHSPGDYVITLNGIQDASAAQNEIAPNTIGRYSYVVEDNTPPVIVTAVLKTDKMLIVDFSEPLDRESAENKANYVINNSIKVESAVLTSSNNQVILGTSPHTAGEYILTVNGIKDASPKKNEIAPYSQFKYSWSPVDTIGPSLISAAAITNDYIKLVFSEPLDAVGSQKSENYTIEPYVEVKNAVLDANTLSQVWLLTASQKPGTYTITVKNVKDRAFTPNPMSSQNSVEYTYTPPDTVPPRLVSVQLRTPMSLSLVFDEPLSRTSAENISNYTIEPNIDVKQAYLLASLTTVHLETSPHQPSVNYKVRIQGIEDRAPVPNKITKPIEAGYTYTPPDTSPPVLLSVKLHGTSLLELIFNEPLEKSSAERRGNYHIDPSVEVLNASLDTTTLAKVFLETTDHMPGVGYQINVQNVKDRAPIPNTIKPTWFSYSMPSSGGMADNIPPQVAMVDVISADRIDIVFTEPVDKATAGDKNNYSINNEIVIKSASVDSDLVRVKLKTSQHQFGKSYLLRVSNIHDLASKPNVLSASTPIKYLIEENAALSDLNKNQYEFTVFHAGDSSYVDRNYTIVKSPECLDGAIQILTANDDKTSTGDAFVTFELRGEATIFLAYDKHISKIPQWLSDWKATGDQIVDSRSNVFQIYTKEADEGRVVLGGNCGTIDDNMYLVFLVPHLTAKAVLADLNKKSYQTERVSLGDPYYIDREYTIASIPDSLKGLFWIKTANDDKTNRDEDFLHFTLNRSSVVYVAYDSRIASLPKWLVTSWEKFDGQIVDSRGTKFDVFYKNYPAGEVVLGGNCGSVDDNMYFVLIKPEKGAEENAAELPGYFALEQNYPNPFNPVTTIRYSVHKSGHITLTVFNILGQRVKVLVDDYREASVKPYQTIWDGRDERGVPVASGVYLYMIREKNFAKVKRMILMR